MLEQDPRREAVRHCSRSRLSELSDECLISSKPVKELLGNCSDMHIWRLLNEEKYELLAFPKPFKINHRNYWRLGAVRQWIRDREAQSQRVSPYNDGGELAPDGDPLFVGQKRPRPVACREPHVTQLGKAPAHGALPAGIAGIGASRKQSLPSKPSRARTP